jgi:hypothetical protein
MYDTHVKQRDYIKSGLVMSSRLVYPNTWTLAGNYRPNLCKALISRMPNAFAY